MAERKSESYQITIKYEAETNRVLINGSPMGCWMDLGLAIEGICLLMAMERLNNYSSAKQKNCKTREELTEYVIDYLRKAEKIYNNPSVGIPFPNLYKI
ncbi:MAG TPA: hypothetical protein VK255_03260 [Patescibacteria group bacterium]|nr:hypothetical protein [Patescibacteria group bacterium]